MDHSQDNRPSSLTTEELESLRKDMHEASIWMRAELRRRTENRRSAEVDNQAVTLGGD